MLSSPRPLLFVLRPRLRRLFDPPPPSPSPSPSAYTGAGRAHVQHLQQGCKAGADAADDEVDTVDQDAQRGSGKGPPQEYPSRYVQLSEGTNRYIPAVTCVCTCLERDQPKPFCFCLVKFWNHNSLEYNQISPRLGLVLLSEVWGIPTQPWGVSVERG